MSGNELNNKLKQLIDAGNSDPDKKYLGEIKSNDFTFEKKSVIRSLSILSFKGNFAEDQNNVRLNLDVELKQKYEYLLIGGMLLFLVAVIIHLIGRGVDISTLSYFVVPLFWFWMLRIQIGKEVNEFKENFEETIANNG